MKARIFTILIIVAVAVGAQEVTKVGTTAAGFLNIDVGARAIDGAINWHGKRLCSGGQ